jgi:hypothetical protein
MTKNIAHLHEKPSARILPVARLGLSDGLFQTAADPLASFDLVLKKGVLASPGVVQL